MDPWSIGIDKALGCVVSGVEARNGSLAQIGFDRLEMRNAMSPELGGALPSLCAEAVQEGAAKAWRKAMDSALARKQPPDLSEVCKDIGWALGIAAQKDEWSRLCVETALELMASSSARCAGQVAAMGAPSLAYCEPAASSFFCSLHIYSALARSGPVDNGASRAVGAMLDAYGAGPASAGAIWGKCSDLEGLVKSGTTGEPGERWPGRAQLSAAMLTRAMDAGRAEPSASRDAPVERPSPAKRAPRS